MEDRPVKIDPADGPCPVCEGRPMEGMCADCKEARALYVAPSADHFHLDKLGGAIFWRAMPRDLCLDCYLADFATVYPGEDLPAL